MVPAHPPLPTPANLPFQFPRGSHTSNRIFDSFVGRITPATRQKGGRSVIGLLEPGGVNDPVVIVWVAVNVVSGRCCLARARHDEVGSVCDRTTGTKIKRMTASSSLRQTINFIYAPQSNVAQARKLLPLQSDRSTSSTKASAVLSALSDRRLATDYNKRPQNEVPIQTC